MNVRDMLDQEANILVESYVRDEFGEDVSAGFGVESSGVPCKERPMSAEMKAENGYQMSRIMARIYFDVSPFPEGIARKRVVEIEGRRYRPVESLNINRMDEFWHVDAELIP